jgi:hypothetical protein
VSLAVILCCVAAYSSYQQLHNTPVQAPEAGRELEAFSHTIGDSAVLFLGNDDFVPWQLRPAAVTTLAPNAYSRADATARVNKPWVSDEALDFDSVNPADLGRFRYAVTSNSSYASQAPANFQLLKAGRLYDLWERSGPSVPRQILEPSGAPGAILNCSTPLGRRLRAHRGEAAIMPTPIVVPGFAFLPGRSGVVSLALPSGQWELSIQYTSSFPVALDTGARRWSMPAYLGRMGPFFTVGAVAGRGPKSPLRLTIGSQRPSALTGSGGNLFTAVQNVVATRVPATERIVPLRRACGRYVDWYRLA